MITEDYVSFEIAKLLKEKGFEVPSFKPEEWLFCMYDEEGKLRWGSYSDDWYCRATLQMTMKWLREEKHIFIEVLVDTMIKGAFTWRLFEYPSLEIMPYDGWEYTYEEACEAAIKYCLKKNLI